MLGIKSICDCKDIWEDSGEPVWDTSTTYSVNSVVEHPSGSGDIWIAIAPSTTAGVGQDSPGQTVMNGNYVALKTILLAGHAVVKIMLEFGIIFLEFQQAKFTSIRLAHKITTKLSSKDM